MRIAFRGIHFFLPMLESIVNEHQIVGITTFEFSVPAFELLAGRHAIPIRAIGPSDKGDPGVEDDCDLCLVAGYPFRVTPPSRVRGINIHPSLLPHGRGPTPITEILLRHRDVAGVTVHKLAYKFDTGDILAQQALPLEETDDVHSYLFRAGLAVREIVPALLADFDARWEAAVPQGTGSYWPKYGDADREIGASDSVLSATRKFKALGNECFFVVAGTRRRLSGVSAWRDDSADTPLDPTFDALNTTLLRLTDGYAVLRWFAPRAS